MIGADVMHNILVKNKAVRELKIHTLSTLYTQLIHKVQPTKHPKDVNSNIEIRICIAIARRILLLKCVF